MSSQAVSFSISSDAAWAPGVATREAWQAWAAGELRIGGTAEPAVAGMPAMQRRRAGFLGRMALEVAYACLGDRRDVPTIFCSRHGEVDRSVEMLSDLARGELLSPTAFGMSVHNATGGMFSIARGDRANNIALSARQDTVEHALIEACGLLSDGEPAVLLVACDCALPPLYANHQDADEEPHAWAWLIEAPRENALSLAWSAAGPVTRPVPHRTPASLDILRFYFSGAHRMDRVSGARIWHWTRHA